ncbi:LysR family transcriptional regulator [Ancylobacter sp. 6x-1]|uniref:LysR family transcriptional regulator n=1 Tax=Ancylobacter crimeensis TaxID=2579147 RepID=A0ABT0D739_9HYPH|nr:LysR family transcriptional regulator [Ancylobacter crimeensis]MCK0195766.1 LysR family transcriptional regulator [Ancylobacter crimeensis]
MVRYTLRQCTYFRAIAEHGGIAQAARALNISQPSVAQALDKLESITGLTLFDRHHARGLTLTLQGRVFLEHVTRLDQQAQQVEREALALAAEAAGEIRLGVFWTLSPFYAAGLIRAFADIAPGVIVRQREMSLTDLADALREGSIDLALTYDRGAEPDGLAFVELAVLRPMIVLAADHPLASRRSINLSDLATESYVMLDGPGSRSYFEGLLAEIGINPHISYVSTSLEAVRSAVAAGFGFTLLVMRPPSSLTYDGGRVKTLRIDNEVRPLRVVLASRDGAHRGLILRRFAEHAVRYFAALKEPAS